MSHPKHRPQTTTAGLLLGREVEYIGRGERGVAELQRGRVVQEGPWLLVENAHGQLLWKAPEEVTLITPGHPAGLRPVAFSCPDTYEGEQQGWLVALHPHEADCTDAVVEGPDGRLLVLYAEAVRFIDRDRSHAPSSAAPAART